MDKTIYVGRIEYAIDDVWYEIEDNDGISYGASRVKSEAIAMAKREAKALGAKLIVDVPR